MNAWGVAAVSIFARDVAARFDLDDKGQAAQVLGVPLEAVAIPDLSASEAAELGALAETLLLDLEGNPPEGSGSLTTIARHAISAGGEAPRQSAGLVIGVDPVFLLGLIFLLRLRRMSWGSLELEFSNEGVARLLKALGGVADSQAAHIDARIAEAAKDESKD